MYELVTLLSILIVTFATGLFSLRGYTSFLTNRQIVDVSNHRSSHSGAVLRGGGLAPLTAIVLATSLAYWIKSDAFYMFYGISIFLAGGLGWIEDWKGLSIRWRLLAQITLAISISSAFIGYQHLSWFWLIPLTIGIAGYTNAANFMDGINGISALHGILCGFYFCVVGLLNQWDVLAVCGAILAAGFLSFLPGNACGQIFLGDVGSYVLGTGVVLLAIATFFFGANAFVAVAPCAIYFADTTYTLVRRVRRGEPWYASHREHVYQRLTPAYFTHMQTSAIVTGLSAIVALLALSTIRLSSPSWMWLSILIGSLVVASYIMSPELMGKLKETHQ